MIRQAIRADASAVARLHQKTLKNSFLAKLGKGFLTSLYLFLIRKELVLVYEEQQEIRGFVSFSSDSSCMMQRFLFTSPGCIFRLLGIFITSPHFLKQFIETFAAPFKSKNVHSPTGKKILPHSELLSISVDPGCQQGGIGTRLLKALEEQLIRNEIPIYKVIAGISLESANKFYQRNNFTLVSQVMIHGNELSNIYMRELPLKNHDLTVSQTAGGNRIIS